MDMEMEAFRYTEMEIETIEDTEEKYTTNSSSAYSCNQCQYKTSNKALQILEE